MPVPSSIVDLSTTPESNTPLTTDSVAVIDDYFQAIQAIIKQQESSGSNIASAATINIPDAGQFFTVTGTTAIGAIASEWNGRTVVLMFSGAVVLTHSSNLLLPGGANITTAANDTAIFSQVSSGVWVCVAYKRASELVSLVSPALTGTPTAPTASPGTNNTQIATTAFATQLAFSAVLPAQTGNAGKFLTTDGSTASWSGGIPDFIIQAQGVI